VSNRYQRGFSLLEVLVAFAILAISLGVLMQVFSRATIATAVSSQYSRAASLAESLLNGVGTEIQLTPGAVSGESDDGFAWEVTMTPVEFGEDSLTDANGTPYRVNATALWRDGGRARQLTLSTLRLGENP
jgi:general secretion pathway protein I